MTENPSSTRTTTTTANNNDAPPSVVVVVVVLLVCGLPGCGKSTLARSLCSSCTDDPHSPIHVDYVEYDALQETLARRDNLTPLEAWRRTRTVALEHVRSFLTHAVTTGPIVTNTQPQQPAQPHVLLLDDNFHLRGMRQQVYRVCRSFVTPTVAVAFGIAWLAVPSDRALSRNAGRDPPRRVTTVTWDRLAAAAEPPDPTRSWETHVRVFRLGDHTTDDPHASTRHVSVLRDWIASTAPRNAETVPWLPPVVETDAVPVPANEAHVRDQQLRRLVRAVAVWRPEWAAVANQTRRTLGGGRPGVADTAALRRLFRDAFVVACGQDWDEAHHHELDRRLHEAEI
jgi:tRNA uridine 5-carbamoylmethylation protein Kti12